MSLQKDLLMSQTLQTKLSVREIAFTFDDT